MSAMDMSDAEAMIPKSPLKILLVDDHPLLRQGLTEVIHRQPDLQVCAEAEDRTQAMELAQNLRPDLVIADLGLKSSNGLDLIKDLRAQFPAIKILVVSMQEETLFAERALRAGANGYITKQEATTRVVHAIRQVLGDGFFLSGQLAEQIASKLVGRPRSSAQAELESLADRELEVLQLLGQGFAVRQICERLRLDKSTVETYRLRIREKLGLKDASELRQFAIAWYHNRRDV
jgi:DNA-binding NarL/FixJ family response regulator